MAESAITTEELGETADKLYGYDVYLHGMANAIIRSAMAIVSVISSAVLIRMILRSNARLSTTIHRILLGMSISDILYSSSMAYFNITAPADIDYIAWNARGDQATCSAQGFIFGVGMGTSLLYSCSLNLYFLAVVRYNKTDEHIRSRIEPFLHGVPIVTTLSVMVALLLNNNLNVVHGGICYGPVYRPLHCIGYDDGETREGFHIPCGRGADGVPLLSYTFFFVLMVIVPLIIGVSLRMIYRSVLAQESRIVFRANAIADPQPGDTDEGGDDSSGMNRLGSSARSIISWLKNMISVCGPSSVVDRERSNSSSREVLHRAFAYSVAFFLAWGVSIVGACFTAADVQWPLSIWYLTDILNPLQGLFNVLVYLSPMMK